MSSLAKKWMKMYPECLKKVEISGEGREKTEKKKSHRGGGLGGGTTK